jgi:hypothetical protein
VGTNFYYVNKKEKIHIGKRSAGGYFCWDCGLTLCTSGTQGVHKDISGWYDKCPKCGAKPKRERLSNSAAGRELGFNTKRPNKKNGVRSCSTFRWAIKPAKLFLDTTEKTKIVDEYGSIYTWEEFQQVLKECAIEFYNSINYKFS